MPIENLEEEFKNYKPEEDREKQAVEMGLPPEASWPEVRAAQLKRVKTGQRADFKIQSVKPKNTELKGDGRINPDLNN